MLQSALEGAKADGAETELINLYDYEYKGCVSCLACKRKGSKANGLCAYKDALSTILEKCGGMVDTGDLKSPGSNTVPVRVRSPAPIPVQSNIAG